MGIRNPPLQFGIRLAFRTLLKYIMFGLGPYLISRLNNPIWLVGYWVVSIIVIPGGQLNLTWPIATPAELVIYHLFSPYPMS